MLMYVHVKHLLTFRVFAFWNSAGFRPSENYVAISQLRKKVNISAYKWYGEVQKLLPLHK